MHITDMDHDVVQEMLTYVYSGRCSKDIGEMGTVLWVIGYGSGLASAFVHWSSTFSISACCSEKN